MGFAGPTFTLENRVHDHDDDCECDDCWAATQEELLDDMVASLGGDECILTLPTHPIIHSTFEFAPELECGDESGKPLAEMTYQDFCEEYGIDPPVHHNCKCTTEDEVLDALGYAQLLESCGLGPKECQQIIEGIAGIFVDGPELLVWGQPANLIVTSSSTRESVLWALPPCPN